MQINLHQPRQPESELKDNRNLNINDFSISNLFYNNIQKLFDSGCRRKDILILTRARRMIPAIDIVLKNKNMDRYTFSTMTYHSLAEQILRNYGFLRNKKRLNVIGRYDQKKMIKEICRSINGYLNYKELILFIVNCKSSYHINTKEMSFSSFLQSKADIQQCKKNLDMIGDSDEPQFSDHELDNYASDIFHIYQDTLKKNNMADLEDLINFTTQIMKYNPEVISSYRRRYKFAFIDNTKNFLTRKKNINNFVSILFINDGDNQRYPIYRIQNEKQQEGTSFQFYSLNSHSKFLQCPRPLRYSFTPNFISSSNDNLEGSLELSDFNQNKIFSEVSDFETESENGFNLDVFSFDMNHFSANWNQNKPDFEKEKNDEDMKPVENDSTQVLSDFEEEEDYFSDFDFDYDDDSDDPNFFEESSENGVNHTSSRMTKNKYLISNSLKRKKAFINEPTMYNDYENTKRERRYSYCGQNPLLRRFSRQIKKSSFFSDDNYE